MLVISGIILAVLFAVICLCLFFITFDKDINSTDKQGIYILSALFLSLSLYLSFNVYLYNNRPWEIDGEIVTEIKNVSEEGITKQTLLFVYKDKAYTINLNKHFNGFIDNQNKVRVIFWKTQYGIFRTEQEQEYSLEIINDE